MAEQNNDFMITILKYNMAGYTLKVRYNFFNEQVLHRASKNASKYNWPNISVVKLTKT